MASKNNENGNKGATEPVLGTTACPSTIGHWCDEKSGLAYGATCKAPCNTKCSSSLSNVQRQLLDTYEVYDMHVPCHSGKCLQWSSHAWTCCPTDYADKINNVEKCYEDITNAKGCGVMAIMLDTDFNTKHIPEDEVFQKAAAAVHPPFKQGGSISLNDACTICNNIDNCFAIVQSGGEEDGKYETWLKQFDSSLINWWPKVDGGWALRQPWKPISTPKTSAGLTKARSLYRMVLVYI